MTTDWYKSRNKLALVWTIGFALAFTLILIQSLVGRYEDYADKVWDWFYPNIVPTLSLIVGVYVHELKAEKTPSRKVSRSLYYITYTFSLVYLSAILLSILMQPLSSMTALEIIEMSKVWLLPLQGLVTASLGAFFSMQ